MNRLAFGSWRGALLLALLVLLPLDAEKALSQVRSSDNPQLVEDEKGKLHFARLQSGELVYMWSEDQGATWQQETLPSSVVFPKPTWPVLAVDLSGHAYIFYNLNGYHDGIDEWWGQALACATNVSGLSLIHI